MDRRSRIQVANPDQPVTLYHVIYAHEGFGDAARALFELVRRAQEAAPDRPRVLYLDIEGHRDLQGEFDAEMLELQYDFVVGVLGRFLSKVQFPVGTIANSRPQENNIPERLEIQDAPPGAPNAPGPRE